MKPALKLTLGFAAAVALSLAVAGGWAWFQLNASLPDYDGERMLAGLAAPVTVERDALGVATIKSRNVHDEARALGYVHAQERFFQMDLMRRDAAGELSALFGAAAVDYDARRRMHAMRAMAESVVDSASVEYRGLLEAYAEGVNAGLGALGVKPFEYLLLRADPVPWKPADTVLVGAAMFFDLQGGHALHKRHAHTARQVLPEAFTAFLYPRFTDWDTPLVGMPGSPARVPGAEVYDLRELDPGLFETDDSAYAPTLPVGSNNWAVHGDHTASGRALLANDMHLGLRMPPVWFRAALVRGGRRVTGVTLPGVPLVVVGSNGDVAWGFTNSYGDWLDLIELELHPDDPGRYRTPDGWREFETVKASIEVAREAPRSVEYRRTVWGPVLDEFADGTPYAVRWVAHLPRAHVSGFLDLAGAEDIHAALSAAQRSGIPAQNFVAADAHGNIGWTVMGQIPRRVRTDGRVSRSADGPAWDGWLATEEFPVVVNPGHGRIWTANSRVVEGRMLERIGDGNYALGSRARQIRDRLFALDRATIDDMLAIQLDDEARFLGRWNELLLTLLDTDTVASDARYAGVREQALRWSARAAVDSTGYRVVRGWRNTLIGMLVDALTAEVRARDPDWRLTVNHAEHWAWALVTQEPAHLLDPRFDSWKALKLAALDRVFDDMRVADAGELAERTWGERNTVHIRHPLSRSVPFLSRWLDMPPARLPGDAHMPRVQSPGFGASQRMAVSPGDEANGYFHMPGGQSGHPRSPYYGAGHADWVEGRRTPFLPGEPERILELVPSP